MESWYAICCVCHLTFPKAWAISQPMLLERLNSCTSMKSSADGCFDCVLAACFDKDG